MTDEAEARMDSGRMLNVDLAPVPDYYRQRFPMLRDANYFTSLGNYFQRKKGRKKMLNQGVFKGGVRV